MRLKPNYFVKTIQVDDYTFYENDNGRIYVPRTSDFNKFLDKLWELTEDKSPEAEKNYSLCKRYPWLFMKNRWDGGTYLYEDNDENSLQYHLEYHTGWFTRIEGRAVSALDFKLFIKMQEALLKHFKSLKVKGQEYFYTITDVKEKYDTFRWYDMGNTEKGHKIVRKYLDKFNKIYKKRGYKYS